MEEKDNGRKIPDEGQVYKDEPLDNGNGRVKDLPLGFYVLLLACIWALYELIRSILYFF